VSLLYRAQRRVAAMSDRERGGLLLLAVVALYVLVHAARLR
jgi:hypothetical protein